VTCSRRLRNWDARQRYGRPHTCRHLALPPLLVSLAFDLFIITMCNGTKWPCLCWCAVKTRHTHSLTSNDKRSVAHALVVCYGKITSQVPYFEDFVGPPHTFTVDYDDVDALREVLDNVTNSAVYLPFHNYYSFVFRYYSYYPSVPACRCRMGARTKCACSTRKTRNPALARVSRPFRLYLKASIWLPVAERKRYPGVTTVPYAL